MRLLIHQKGQKLEKNKLRPPGLPQDKPQGGFAPLQFFLDFLIPPKIFIQMGGGYGGYLEPRGKPPPGFGFGPGSRPWQGRVLPLDYGRLVLLFLPKNIKTLNLKNPNQKERETMNENKKTSPLLPRPVNEGDELDVTIVSKGKKDGDGIAKTKEGFVIVVEGGGQVGKTYHVKITRVGLTVAWAQIIN